MTTSQYNAVSWVFGTVIVVSMFVSATAVTCGDGSTGFVCACNDPAVTSQGANLQRPVAVSIDWDSGNAKIKVSVTDGVANDAVDVKQVAIGPDDCLIIPSANFTHNVDCTFDATIDYITYEAACLSGDELEWLNPSAPSSEKRKYGRTIPHSLTADHIFVDMFGDTHTTPLHASSSLTIELESINVVVPEETKFHVGQIFSIATLIPALFGSQPHVAQHERVITIQSGNFSIVGVQALDGSDCTPSYAMLSEDCPQPYTGQPCSRKVKVTCDIDAGECNTQGKTKVTIQPHCADCPELPIEFEQEFSHDAKYCVQHVEALQDFTIATAVVSEQPTATNEDPASILVHSWVPDLPPGYTAQLETVYFMFISPSDTQDTQPTPVWSRPTAAFPTWLDVTANDTVHFKPLAVNNTVQDWIHRIQGGAYAVLQLRQNANVDFRISLAYRIARDVGTVRLLMNKVIDYFVPATRQLAARDNGRMVASTSAEPAGFRIEGDVAVSSIPEPPVDNPPRPDSGETGCTLLCGVAAGVGAVAVVAVVVAIVVWQTRKTGNYTPGSDTGDDGADGADGADDDATPIPQIAQPSTVKDGRTSEPFTRV